jgi:3-deoxy-D-manno-octulosonic-acid transferase
VDSAKSLNYFWYNLFLAVAGLFLVPFFVARNWWLRRPVLAYFRGLSREAAAELLGKPVIWIHAVSVGETVAADCMIKRIMASVPEYSLVFTTTTPTGREMAKKLFGGQTMIVYFPFDFPWMMKRFVSRVNPRLFIMVEKEIWPNAIRYARRGGAKVAIVNGQVSERSFRRYQKFGFFMKEVLAQIDQLAMQTVEDANRIGKLGAPLHRIVVTGNIKFDQDYPVFSTEQLDDFRQRYGWDRSIPIVAAASTHRGEEEMVIEAYQRLTRDNPYYLILAPRHTNRAEEVGALLKRANIRFHLRSGSSTDGDGASVLLVDTMGELGLVYAVADYVFVGGSLTNIGGHNVMEAAAQAKPVIYGPYMQNQLQSRMMLEAASAGYTVQNAIELAERIESFRSDPEQYRKLAAQAKRVVFDNQGAAGKTAQLMIDLARNDQ